MALRWRFPDSSEATDRANVEARIADWWGAFSAKAPEIEAHFAGEQRFDLEEWLTPELRKIDELLFWEFRRSTNRTWTFVISCEDNRALQPLVDHIVARAPKWLAFAVTNQREAESVEAALLTVEGRFQVDASQWTVDVSTTEHGLMSVRWSGANGIEEDRAHAAAVTLTQCLLGEHEMGDWVGFVGVSGRSLLSRVFGGNRARVVDFSMQFAAVKAGLLERMADRPLLVSSRNGADEPWAVVTVEPRADGVGRQPDLAVARTLNVEFLSASRGGVPFSSCRFSRFGETFAFVQTEGFEGTGFTSSADMEEALNAALVENGLGRAIGTGTGSRFNSVDLVLANPERAIEPVLNTLRAGKVSKRAWLRFFDDTLANEWVGVWPDSPPPPQVTTAD